MSAKKRDSVPPSKPKRKEAKTQSPPPENDDEFIAAVNSMRQGAFQKGKRLALGALTNPVIVGVARGVGIAIGKALVGAGLDTLDDNPDTEQDLPE